MKVLLYGGGAREHAIALKIKSSPMLTELYLCSPNDGFSHLGKVISYSSYEDLAIKAEKLKIDLLIVGPEAPLVEGIVDLFEKAGILCIGPNKEWAMLEGSKIYAKEFMIKNNIPTAEYKIQTECDDSDSIIDSFTFPIVIKADGLAAGKGVSIVHNKNVAKTLIKEFLNGKFGQSSKKMLIEEYLEGEELSLIALWDSKTLLPFVSARDYKRLQNGNKGPNTGGMGSYCPIKLTPDQENDLNKYIKLLENALRNEHAKFTGIIYSGLMLTDSGIKVLEYNMRFGDPETQPLLNHLETDLLYIFDKAIKRELHTVKLKWKEGSSFCVVVASQGYPEQPKKQGLISGIEEIQQKYNVNIYYAGVKRENDLLLANGGRVLSICKSGKNPAKDVYAAVNDLEFEDKCYRTDIGS